jgi:hypothetical protein
MTQSRLPPPLVRIVGPGSPAEPGGLEQTATGASSPRRSLKQVASDIVLFFAAPFVTLAYVPLFPFIGAAMLMRAWRHRKQAG